MLTIPIRDDVLTETTGQIKKSALDRLFRELRNPGERSRWDIYQEVGIILAKKSEIKAKKGGYRIRDKIIPALDLFLKIKTEELLGRIV